jgi:hypothetical protein
VGGGCCAFCVKFIFGCGLVVVAESFLFHGEEISSRETTRDSFYHFPPTIFFLHFDPIFLSD